MQKTLLWALSALVLTACGGPLFTGEPASLDPICLESACTPGPARLLNIPDAENLLVTGSGRVFVSGGTNVFEVQAGEDGLIAAVEQSEQACNFTGLAQIIHTLYAACGDGGLYAMSLSDPHARLERIYELTNMNLPNGMIDGPDDCLYIVDGPLSTAIPNGKIVRACPRASDPLSISTQEVWLDLSPDLPNGITRIGRSFYLTDSTLLGAISRVRRVYMDADGRPSEPLTLYEELTVFDGLSAYGDTLLVTDFAAGRVFQISKSGELLQESEAGTLFSPSSIQVAAPPLFHNTDVLITEKGILGDTSSDLGNTLSLFRASPDSGQ